jgi:hypothetical protein
MRILATSLIVAAFAWPALLAAATWELVEGRTPAWSAIVYAAASKVCHQRPERSFHTAGVKWPVCGRCSGLYLAAPIGALAAAGALWRRAKVPGPRRSATGRAQFNTRRWLALAAVPTVAALIVEWLNLAPVSNLARALSALPLGAMIAFVLVRTAAGEA